METKVKALEWYNKYTNKVETKVRVLEWWNTHTDKEKLELSLKHYDVLDLKTEQIIIAWRRETGGEFA